MSRNCSQCGNSGHNSRTCVDNGFKLFGVKVMDGCSMRKSASMNNLSNLQHYEHSDQVDGGAAALDGYVSDDLVHSSTNCRERKRGIPWTEEEHRLFLLGLQKVGKGDWRGISRNFVKTRTPTQVASHAQKYFLRQSNLNRRRRRSSLFDITTDTFMSIPVDEELVTASLNHPPLPPSITKRTNKISKEPEGTNVAAPMSMFPITLSPVVLLGLPIRNPPDTHTQNFTDTDYSENTEPFKRPWIPEKVSDMCGTHSNCMKTVPSVHHGIWNQDIPNSDKLLAPIAKLVRPIPSHPIPPLPPPVQPQQTFVSSQNCIMKPSELSLKLSEQQQTRHSAFRSTTSLDNRELDSQAKHDNVISVA
eukprot:TRINITY_DN1285_c0_g1_i1.p1 TRINITY_DN1285_c0_g1~~TRINITY_DN1285_c0_g1_i1.p1  ORF type:complete len:361 (+),score=29.06 TRINITY_DN1285_c0_g1_i1:476-1558(+)